MKKTGPGIYKMINVANGNFYIGSTNNISKRIGRHKYLLKKGYTDNIRIKNDCDKYGINSFNFEILEFCELSKLKEREQYYYELLNPYYNVWNSIYSAKDRGYTLEQLESFKGKTNHIKDKDSFREKLKLAWIRRKLNPNYKEILQKSSRLGFKHSSETLKAMSIQRKGKNKPDSMSEKLRQHRLGTKWDPVNKTWIKP